MLEEKLEQLLKSFTKENYINDRPVTVELQYDELAEAYAAVKAQNVASKVMEESLLNALDLAVDK